jgi:hypothetical protein
MMRDLRSAFAGSLPASYLTRAVRARLAHHGGVKRHTRQDDASAIELWPELLIQETDAVPDHFDAAVAGLVEHRFEAASDAEIFEVIRRVVLDLNEVDARHDGPPIDALAAADPRLRYVVARVGVDDDTTAFSRAASRTIRCCSGFAASSRGWRSPITPRTPRTGRPSRRWTRSASSATTSR